METFKVGFKKWLSSSETISHDNAMVTKLASISGKDENLPDDGCVMDYVAYFASIRGPERLVEALEMSFLIYAPFRIWLSEAVKLAPAGHQVDKTAAFIAQDANFPDSTYSEMMARVQKKGTKEDVSNLRVAYTLYAQKVHSKTDEPPFELLEKKGSDSTKTFLVWLSEYAAENPDSEIAKLDRLATNLGEGVMPNNGSLLAYMDFLRSVDAPDKVLDVLEEAFALFLPYKEWLVEDLLVDPEATPAMLKMVELVKDDEKFPATGTMQQYLDHIRERTDFSAGIKKRLSASIRSSFKEHYIKKERGFRTSALVVSNLLKKAKAAKKREANKKPGDTKNKEKSASKPETSEFPSESGPTPLGSMVDFVEGIIKLPPLAFAPPQDSNPAGAEMRVKEDRDEADTALAALRGSVAKKTHPMVRAAAGDGVRTLMRKNRLESERSPALERFDSFAKASKK